MIKTPSKIEERGKAYWDYKNRVTQLKPPENPQAKLKRRAKLYRITHHEIKRLWSIQNGKCDICERDLSEFKAVIDHSHTTGKVRGILCYSCNLALGLIREKIDVLNRMKLYIVKNLFY